MREVDIQSLIIRSAKAQGGWGVKLTHKFRVGVVDLLLVMPRFAPFVAEVKQLGKVPERFDQKLDVTPTQRKFMQDVNAPNIDEGRGSAIILVAIHHRGEWRLVRLPPTAERLSFEYEDDPSCWVPRQSGGFDLFSIIINAGLIRA